MIQRIMTPPTARADSSRARRHPAAVGRAPLDPRLPRSPPRIVARRGWASRSWRVMPFITEKVGALHFVGAGRPDPMVCAWGGVRSRSGLTRRTSAVFMTSWLRLHAGPIRGRTPCLRIARRRLPARPQWQPASRGRRSPAHLRAARSRSNRRRRRVAVEVSVQLRHQRGHQGLPERRLRGRPRPRHGGPLPERTNPG